jgi:hypothetical protein
MSTNSLEDAYEADDDRTLREREIEDYRAAVQHLDPEDVLMASCGSLPFQQPSALLELIKDQMREPYEDISRAHIHPDLAQRIARDFLEAVSVTIDGMATMGLMARR